VQKNRSIVALGLGAIAAIGGVVLRTCSAAGGPGILGSISLIGIGLSLISLISICIGIRSGALRNNSVLVVGIRALLGIGGAGPRRVEWCCDRRGEGDGGHGRRSILGAVLAGVFFCIGGGILVLVVIDLASTITVRVRKRNHSIVPGLKKKQVSASKYGLKVRGGEGG
jgi:hypothetical protein